MLVYFCPVFCTSKKIGAARIAPEELPFKDHEYLEKFFCIYILIKQL
ncbi:MAG: hypothetical protein WDZ41_05375 [Candidatus Babeliales bacterium]